MDEDGRPTALAPPLISALKEESGGRGSARGLMERTISMDIREEREDLKEAAEQTLNVIMDLGLDSKIRWVSPSWQEVIGTSPESVQGKPISEIVVGNETAFAGLIESMKEDDSRSQIIRFAVRMGPLSVLRSSTEPANDDANEEEPASEELIEQDHLLSLEAQGIMVYDRSSGGESHTMWMIRPSILREVTIDLPEVLVKSLGVGAEMLAHYLTVLADVGINDPGNHPPPLPLLCRICERQITPWWFEKHTELCLQEHSAEMDVQLAHETLTEHRNAIVKVLDALEAQSHQSRSASTDAATTPPPPAEYKGLPIGPSSSPSSGMSSGRASPAVQPSRSRENSSSGFGHHRAKSFAVRRPLSRIVELVLDLCDTALEISTPAIKEVRFHPTAKLRTQSPQSENRISQVLQWQSPSASTLEQELGLSALCNDTARLAKAKVETIFRHRGILEYSERIRIEFDVMVEECIEAAMRKAARIAAGELSDSSDDTTDRGEEVPGEQPSTDGVMSEFEDGFFAGSFDGPSAMVTALRSSSSSLLAGRRKSSAGSSTRSSSPRGSKTPKSHAGAMSAITLSKRASMAFESDAGGDSDGSVRSSIVSGPRRADSPGSEVSLSRVTSSRERKRQSLVLPSAMSSSRQQSPARSMPPPSSPLRMAKPRLPSGHSIPSPITSPVLSTSEFSSPLLAAQHLYHHHRRQSSAASSGILPGATSPRLSAVSSNPQPRAVQTSIKDFEIIKPISKGAFGSVYLSKKKSTGDYYAIKVLRKADMVAKNQVTNVKAERAIMMWQGESDFVAKLYWTFASKDYLYLVMEYLNGGDCASLIKVLGGLPEDWGKKYLGEVVLGVEHLHSRGIIHRDLKPDNLLIDQKGHLKLTDFGLSRMGLIGRQKNAYRNKKPNPPGPDLLKQGSFPRTLSIASSRSASFDLQGNHSPGHTPSLTPAIASEIGQPSYFSLYRENSVSQEPPTRVPGHRSDSGDSDALQAMFRKFSLAEDPYAHQRQAPIEEGNCSEEDGSPDPYFLQPVTSQSSSNTPPPLSSMPPPPMALFDPDDSNRKFVGTPDYLAPETINGAGQDEVSDWWSLGCILFECLYGYPPFHADTPDEVFQNILARKIDWPDDEDCPVSDEAKDLMNRLMCLDPICRLGANAGDKYASGGEEIRAHPWFADLDWSSLRENEASFIPAPENPEDTEYFDARGATLQNFAQEFEDQASSPSATPGTDYPQRPYDALSRVRSQVNSIKRNLMPLHIPPHVRDGRSRRLSEPVVPDEFGSFAFKNLPVLERANKDVLQKLRTEALQIQGRPTPTAASMQAAACPLPPAGKIPELRSLGSPFVHGPSFAPSLGHDQIRAVHPSILSPTNSSPSATSRISQPSSPLLVSFSAGQNHEPRKTSSGSASGMGGGSSQFHSSLAQNPGFFELPSLPTSFKTSSNACSPIKAAKPNTMTISKDKTLHPHRQSSVSLGPSALSSPRGRSQTVGSQDGDLIGTLLPSHHKRRSQVFDVSPSSSDNEDPRQKALLRVQRRRQSSRRMSQITLADGPVFRSLDVLICEDHPVTRLVLEKLLEKLRCRTITCTNGSEVMRYAMGEVKFDIILMEFKLPQMNGADVARMIRSTKNANSHTPIVACTGYLKDLQAPHHFDTLMEKPPTTSKLTEILGRLCQWKPPPPGFTPARLPVVPINPSSSLRRESLKLGDSPTSNTSSFGPVPSSSWRGSSREDSISSSFFGDVDSRAAEEIPVVINRQATDDWRDLPRALGGLGITEEPTAEPSMKSMMPPLIQQNSSPAAIGVETTASRKQPSTEAIMAKRKSIDADRHESADSGDDEDEELGDVQVRERSPKGRSMRSKLGTEMLRTNSQGSVVSAEDLCTFQPIVNSPPPAISEDVIAEQQEEGHGTITPPELFPRIPGDKVETIDMDATPRASISPSV
ncbi:hypothetical protein LTR04_006925 [Oleoguttula sp. CCFEE 6159]|nr:hypothetical protein LTR04_006925 [Oleoguttula sp. CCFEE 6159]